MVIFIPARPKEHDWEKKKDCSLILAKIRGTTWNVLNMQHITPNSKTWDYSDILGGGH